MAHGEYGWAFDLLVKGFEQRIHDYLTKERIRRKILEQTRHSDELYEAMLSTTVATALSVPRRAPLSRLAEAPR
jgi:hypothetical protein